MYVFLLNNKYSCLTSLQIFRQIIRKGDNMNAIYARVSTDEQARHGYSLTDQIKRCHDKIGNQPAQEYIDDGYSGEFIDRPALERLRVDVRSGLIKTVVVYDLDRLSRETEHLLILVKEIEKRAKLIFVTNEYAKTPAGELFMTLHAGIAKYEKAMIKERTMRGKQEKAQQGKIICHRPMYGYDWLENASNYAINALEREIIEQVYKLCLTGYSLNQIVKHLNNKGYKNKRNNKWNIKNVYTLLTHEMYTGVYYELRERWIKTGQKEYSVTPKDKSEQIAVPVPAIVTAEMQAQAKQQLTQNFANANRNAKHEYLLSGVIKCAHCGYAMQGTPEGRNFYYICSGKKFRNKECPSKYIPLKDIENAVWSDILEWANGNIDLSSSSITVNYDREMIELQQQEEKILKGMSDITDLVREQFITKDEAKRQLQKVNKELSEIISAKNEVAAAMANKKEILISLDDVLHLNTISEKKKYLQMSGIKVFAKKENGSLYLDYRT
jgi:site-specific DNA recombinase